MGMATDHDVGSRFDDAVGQIALNSIGADCTLGAPMQEDDNQIGFRARMPDFSTKTGVDIETRQGPKPQAPVVSSPTWQQPVLIRRCKTLAPPKHLTDSPSPLLTFNA